MQLTAVDNGTTFERWKSCVELAAQQGDDRPAALVGDVRELDAGERVEQLTGQV
jgi:hypothetical protein